MLRLLSLFALIVFTLSGIQSQTFFSRTFSVEEGLSQSQVITQYEDSLGNIWIGTNGGGVNIYDGKEFRNLTVDDGLVDNIIYCIFGDDKGGIWFGTTQGLSYYYNGSFTNYNDSNGLPNTRVFNICKAKDGTLWFGLGKGAAFMRDGRIEPFSNKNIDDFPVYSVYSAHDGSIWFGTLGNGITIIRPDGKEEHFTSADGLSFNYVRFINEDLNGNTWVGTAKGLSIIKNDSISIVSQNGNYTGFCRNADGSVWFCREGWLIKWEEGRNFTFRYDFSGYYFYAIIKDKEGNLWLGTDGKGLVKIPPFRFVNFAEKDGLNNNNVFCISRAGGENEFWIGANQDGATLLKVNDHLRVEETSTITFGKKKNAIAGSNVFDITRDGKGNIWFCTGNGLTVLKDTIYTNFRKTEYKPRTVNEIVFHFITVPQLPSNIFFCIKEVSDGKLWAGTDNGICIIDDTSFVNLSDKYPLLKQRRVRCLFEDSRNNVWMGCDSGAFVMSEGQLKRYQEAEGFVNKRVSSIAEDSFGNLWFGTKEGVFCYKDGKFSQLTQNEGLASNTVYLVIMDDSDHLFIGTNKGLDRLDTRRFNSEGIVEFRHYGNLEGFMGQECNANACYKDNRGRIWFGTIKGVTVYDPVYDIINELKPITQLKNIQLGFKNVDWSEYSDNLDPNTGLPINLVLPYNNNHITFEFVAASLSIPEKVRYMYLMEGLNNDWSPPLSKNEADYPSLPHGDYTFKVKACNGDGIWSETPTVFSFSITPPFWKTWWFYTVVAIVLLVIIFAYMKYREAALKREKIQLEKIVQERTAEVVMQKEIVEQKNKDITDSINYAKNIQNAILPKISDIKKNYPNSFVLFKPRDIVSGDFYWFNETEEYAFFAAADCTGHGVPGAFMSMLGVTFLNEIVNKDGISDVNEILNHLRNEVIRSLNQQGEVGGTKDGMDIVIISINKKNRMLQYSGANNPLFLIREKSKPSEEGKCLEGPNHNLFEYKGDKMPIAIHVRMESFNRTDLQLLEGDTLYFFTDGFQDQFGGPEDKKFKVKKFKEILLEIQDEPMAEQQKILDRAIENWRTFKFPVGAEIEQVDDILVMGVRV